MNFIHRLRATNKRRREREEGADAGKPPRAPRPRSQSKPNRKRASK